MHMSVEPLPQSRHIYPALPPEISWVLCRLCASSKSNVVTLSACSRRVDLGSLTLLTSSTPSSVRRRYCAGITTGGVYFQALLRALDRHAQYWCSSSTLLQQGQHLQVQAVLRVSSDGWHRNISCDYYDSMIDSPATLQSWLQTASAVAGPRPPPLSQGYAFSDKICISPS